MKIDLKRLVMAVAATWMALAALPAHAQVGGSFYEVSVTNLTDAQAFTPLIFATHSPSIRMFTPGQPAGPELEELAEGGAVGPMADLLSLFPDLVLDVVTTDGLLMAGETTTVQIRGDILRNRLSLAAMLIPTNDSFVGLNAMVLPGRSNSAMAPAFDSGTEENDELCSNIPGPVCGGEGFGPEGGEGYVYISKGMQGIGDLAPDAYDWRNPVAYITIRRIPAP